MGASTSRDEDAALLLAVPKHKKIGKRRLLDPSCGACHVCRKSFGMCNKKHYCRRCGNIVCDACTSMSHYKTRTGHGFRVCETCNIVPLIHIVPQKVWHLILSYCGNVAHHRTIQVCRKMQLSVPLPFPWGDTWDYFFTEGHFLSKGANGSVYKTTMRSDPKRQQVAVKVIQKNTIFSLRKWHHIHREIEALRSCKHPHVVELISVMQSPESVFIVLQFAFGGDLFDWLVSRKHPVEGDVKPIAVQLLSTLHFMHDVCGCVHRDIKPENILLEKRIKGSEVPHIRLADFGFARVFPQLARPQALAISGNRSLAPAHDVVVAATPCGTLGFAAPEIIEAYSSRKEAIRREEEEMDKKGHSQTKRGTTDASGPSSPAQAGLKSPVGSPITPVEMMKKMDIFACGVTLCILLTGCEPFPCHSSKAHLEAVNDGASFDGRHWAHVSAEAKELLRRMLLPNAAKRPTAYECLHSRWLSNMKLSGLSARGHPTLSAGEPSRPTPATGATSATQLLSAKEDEELAMSFQKSLRSLRKNDGMMFVTNAKTGAVQRMQRPEVLEDTLTEEPPVLPPGPSFRTINNSSMGTQPLMSSRRSSTPSQTPRQVSNANDDDSLDAAME